MMLSIDSIMYISDMYVEDSLYRDWFGLSKPRLCFEHRFDTRFPTTPHSDVINHDGSFWDGESKLLQITKRKQLNKQRRQRRTCMKVRDHK